MCDPAPVVEVPCRACGSEGIVDYRVTGIDYRDGSLIEHWRTCPVCNGDGCEVIAREPVTETEIMEQDQDA